MSKGVPMPNSESIEPLAGRVALITGGSRGIGFEAARGIGHLGATVVLVGTDPGRTATAAEVLVAEGIDAVGEGADVSDARAMDALATRLGPLASPDILVISAGVMSDKVSKTLRTSAEEWDRVMGINLDGAFHAMRLFVPGMAERRDGRVITVSACLGRFSGPGTAGGLAPYRVSKAALNAMTKNLAAELMNGKRGVLVDAMCPNHCRTDMGGPDAPRSAAEGADTIVWLASREAVSAEGVPVPTGQLWEDREIVPW
jgi:NAD(P)-dependent dehydrogenase (short-subunit alcohol dehydrogenase family)